MEDVTHGYKVMMVTKTRDQVARLAAALEEEEYPVRQRNKKTGEIRVIYRKPVVLKMVGQDKTIDHKKKLAREGKVDILVCTEVVQMNTDIDRMDCLHDIMPVNNDQTIRQRTGRVTRAHPDKKPPRIRIWRFSAHPINHSASSYLNAVWERREEWYLRHGFDIIDIGDFTKATRGPAKDSYINRKR